MLRKKSLLHSHAFPLFLISRVFGVQTMIVFNDDLLLREHHNLALEIVERCHRHSQTLQFLLETAVVALVDQHLQEIGG